MGVTGLDPDILIILERLYGHCSQHLQCAIIFSHIVLPRVAGCSSLLLLGGQCQHFSTQIFTHPRSTWSIHKGVLPVRPSMPMSVAGLRANFLKYWKRSLSSRFAMALWIEVELTNSSFCEPAGGGAR